jgi:hypothetical protein
MLILIVTPLIYCGKHMRPYTKEIKEIIALGRKLDDLMFETYSLFAQRKDFDVRLTSFWQDMADWKKDHVKHWKKISKAYVFKNIFHRDKDDLRLIIKQLKSIQAELVEFLRRLRKKRITQQDAVSQTTRKGLPSRMRFHRPY